MSFFAPSTIPPELCFKSQFITRGKCAKINIFIIEWSPSLRAKARKEDRLRITATLFYNQRVAFRKLRNTNYELRIKKCPCFRKSIFLLITTRVFFLFFRSGFALLCCITETCCFCEKNVFLYSFNCIGGDNNF